jgi:hypothetical protein
MEVLVGAIGWIVVELLFFGVFYGIGWAVINVVTLGKHPGPWRGAEGLVDAQLVALVGLLTTVGAVVLAVWWWRT